VLEFVGEGIFSEVDARFLGIINKGIDDQLEGRSLRRNGCVRGGRHKATAFLLVQRDRCGVGETMVQGTKVVRLRLEAVHAAWGPPRLRHGSGHCLGA